MNILIISHYFPPYKGVGAKRMGYLAEYLAKKNENVFVITATGCEQKTSSDQIKVFNVSVCRSKNNFFMNQYLWRVEYKKKITQILSMYRMDLIIFSGGPFFYFDLGRYFLKTFGVNYILDYRDPYVEVGISNQGSCALKVRTWLINLIKEKIERTNLRYAKCIINVSQELNDLIMTKYHLSQDKLKVVMNGYDDEAIKDLNNTTGVLQEEFSAQNKTTLAIFGKFGYYSKEHVDVFFSAIKELIFKENFNLHVLQIGEKEDLMVKWGNAVSLAGRYSCVGNIDYKKAMLMLKNVDILVLNNRSENALGTKIFDYIFLNKPIIAFISKRSAISKLLSQFENAYVCESQLDFVLAVKKIIKNNIRILHNDINTENYSRKKQMNIFYDVIRGTLC